MCLRGRWSRGTRRGWSRSGEARVGLEDKRSEVKGHHPVDLCELCDLLLNPETDRMVEQEGAESAEVNPGCRTLVEGFDLQYPKPDRFCSADSASSC